MKKNISILYSLFFLTCNLAQGSVQYLDKEKDNFFNLSKNFDSKDIGEYTEDLGLEAFKRLQGARNAIPNYSLETDLIPQIVQMVAEEALLASQKIIDRSCEGDTVIYLGRSPSILWEASNFLKPYQEQKKEVSHIQINFSGTPNMVNPRNYEINDLRSVITKERLQHFYHYLDSKGLGNLTLNSKLYIVDQVGRGGGMNAFLRILIDYYSLYKGLGNTPQTALLLMNFNNEKSHLQDKCYLFNYKTNDLIFCGSAVNSNYRALKVKAFGLGMSEDQGGALDAMDDEIVQYYLLKGREYPVFCWKEKYDNYRDSNPELAELFSKSLIEKFSEVIEKSKIPLLK